MYLISGSNLPQAKTKGGQGKYNLRYWKITKQLSSKPIKVKKDKTQYFEMKDRNVEVIKSKIDLPENYLNYLYASNQSLSPSLNRVYCPSASGKSFLIDLTTQGGITHLFSLPKMLKNPPNKLLIGCRTQISIK